MSDRHTFYFQLSRRDEEAIVAHLRASGISVPGDLKPPEGGPPVRGYRPSWLARTYVQAALAGRLTRRNPDSRTGERFAAALEQEPQR